MMMLGNEVTVTPFILALDVVNNAIDFNGFLEYLRTVQKKDVTVLNAQEYGEVSHKSSSSKSKHHSKHTNDSSSGVVKGIRGKIDGELSKLLDAKKKISIAAEKATRGRALISNDRTRSRVAVAPVPRFEGRIDMLYVLLNFPYLPHQLRMMRKASLDVSFISIIPEGPIEPNAYVHHESASSKTPQKKAPIIGNELDFTQNPTVYPPARWQSLLGDASASVPFNEVHGDENHEKMFRILELEITRILRAKAAFAEFAKRCPMKNLPVVSPLPDLEIYRQWLIDHEGDYVNGLFAQLSQNRWKVAPARAPPTETELFNSTFAQCLHDSDRRVTFNTRREPITPFFQLDVVPPLFGLLYPLINWQIGPRNALDVQAFSEFLASPANFAAYAGQKFDQMVTAANKKYGLGLPLSYFDFQHWNLQREILNSPEYLIEVLEDVSLPEALFDDKTGVLWLLLLKPIPRTIGAFLTSAPVPLCLENITEYIEKVLERDPSLDKRSRNPPNPAQIIRDSLDFTPLLPSFDQSSGRCQCYKMPMSTSQSAQFTTPYFFDCGLQVKVIRSYTSGVVDFCYNFFYKSELEVVSTPNSFVILPYQGFRVLKVYGRSTTVLFNQQSISFDGSRATLSSTGERPLVVTIDGTFIFTSSKGFQVILFPNGSIAQNAEGHWVTIDKDGHSLDGIDRPSTAVTDCLTGRETGNKIHGGGQTDRIRLGSLGTNSRFSKSVMEGLNEVQFHWRQNSIDKYSVALRHRCQHRSEHRGHNFDLSCCELIVSIKSSFKRAWSNQQMN
jgi:hypothetical protein